MRSIRCHLNKGLNEFYFYMRKKQKKITCSSLSRTISRTSNFMSIFIDQSIRSSVGGYTKDKFVSGRSGFDVELNGRVLKISWPF